MIKISTCQIHVDFSPISTWSLLLKPSHGAGSLEAEQDIPRKAKTAALRDTVPECAIHFVNNYHSFYASLGDGIGDDCHETSKEGIVVVLGQS